MEEHKIGVLVRIKTLMTAFEAFYADDFYFGGENHNFWELVYIIGGKAGISADGRVYELNAGEVIFHKPMEFHKIWAVSKVRPHVFIMSFFADGSRMSEFEDGVYKLSYEQKENIGDVINLFRRNAGMKPCTADSHDLLACWQDNSIFSQIAGNAIERFLLSILANRTKPAALDETKDAKMYRDIVKVLEDHMEEWISVEEVARLCTSSVSNIKKVFGKYANHGIHKYFIKMKIIRAIAILEQGDSVQSISERLAFNNPNYFSMVFKRETGYSPLQYKKIFLSDVKKGGEKIPPVLIV